MTSTALGRHFCDGRGSATLSRVRYLVTLDPSPGATPIEVDIIELGDGKLDVRVDGRPIETDATPVGAAQMSVRCDGQIVDLTTHGQLPNLAVVARGLRKAIRVESERSAHRAHPSTAGSGAAVIKSPMPGRVVRVLVDRGAEVGKGESLVVLEAMKMENDVRAPAGGIVTEVHVSAGATVESGARLVTLTVRHP